jgi:hypothetical protein
VDLFLVDQFNAAMVVSAPTAPTAAAWQERARRLAGDYAEIVQQQQQTVAAVLSLQQKLVVFY